MRFWTSNTSQQYSTFTFTLYGGVDYGCGSDHDGGDDHGFAIKIVVVIIVVVVMIGCGGLEGGRGR